MAQIEKMRQVEPIPGDDLGYHTVRYQDVPIGFRIGDLTIDGAAYPRVAAVHERLTTTADKFYRHHEIVGETLADFKENLQDALDRNLDTIDRVLEVYDDDIAKPILGRTRTVTYNVTDTTESESDGDVRDINVPLDSPSNEDPSARTLSHAEGGGSVSRTGTETEELSDLGVRPNYESLNGFIDNNRSIDQIFINIFHECFMIREALKW